MTFMIDAIANQHDAMTALINDNNQVVLAYQAEWLEDQWRIATKEEFLANYDIDSLLGVDGNALGAEDEIICLNGKIPATVIL